MTERHPIDLPDDHDTDDWPAHYLDGRDQNEEGAIKWILIANAIGIALLFACAVFLWGYVA